jgi:hypothetical protein
MRRETGHFTQKSTPPAAHTQKRYVPSHPPPRSRGCSRLAMDVGEGQRQPRCTASPVRRRWCLLHEARNGSFTRKSTPPAAHIHKLYVPYHPPPRSSFFCCHCHHHACCINYRMFDVFVDCAFFHTKLFLHKNSLTPKSTLQHQKYSSPHQKEEM